MIDLAAQGDPRQRFAGLAQHVVRECPIAFPCFGRQGPARAGQIEKVAALLSFANLLLDRALPLRELAQRPLGFLTQVPPSAWMASPSSEISRESCSSVLISGGAIQIVLFSRRGIAPLSMQR